MKVHFVHFAIVASAFASQAMTGILAEQAMAAPNPMDETAPPLVVKSSGTGFVMPEYSRYETCELYPNQVVITQRLGGKVTFIEKRDTQVEGNLIEFIQSAAGANLKETPNYMCDGPSTVVYANLPTQGDMAEKIHLFETGGCGSPSREREGWAALALRQLIDQYCPTTHQIQP